MQLALRSPRAYVCARCAGVAVTMLLLSGCGESAPKPISAASSGLQAEDDSAAATGAPAVAAHTPPASHPAGAQPAAAAPAPAKPAGATPPAVAHATPPSQAPGAAAASPPHQPEPVAADNLNPFAVPEGTPAELMKFVADLDARLANRQIPGSTRPEMLANVKRLAQAQYEASVKAYSQFPDAKDRQGAAKKALESLSLMGQLGAAETPQQLKDFCEKLKADPDPMLAQQGRTIGFTLLADDIESGKFNRELFFKELEAVLAAEAPSPRLFLVLTGIASRLQGANMTPDAARTFRLIGQTFSKSKDPNAVEQAGELLVLADVLDANLDGLLKNVVDGKPEASPALVAAVDKLLAQPNPGQLLLSRLISLGNTLEYRDQNEAAAKVYAALTAAYSKSADKNLVATVAKLTPNFEKRAKLVGQPIALAGTLAPGDDFDPKKKYAGKVTLLYFWTMGSLSQEELGDLLFTEQQFADRGFTVLGVCVDDDVKGAQQLMARVGLPWDMLYGEQGKGFDQPVALAAGVDVTPSYVLLGADGKVVATQARGEKLTKKLTELLGAPAAVPDALGGQTAPPGRAGAAPQPPAAEGAPKAPATAPPGSDPPAAPAPDDANPASAPPAETPQQAQRARSVRGDFVAAGAVSPFLAAEEQPAEKTAEKSPPQPVENAAPAAEKKPAPEVNPYSADPDLKPAQLAEFILEMRDKPAPIQERPGFLEAVLEASDRILANPQSAERFQLIAISAQFELLHARACLGDEKCQEQLMALVAKMANDARPPVQQEVKLLQLEQRVLEAEKLPLEKIPALVKEVEDYCGQTPLTERHLRLASSTVKAVNRLPDADARDKYFAELGALYAKSEFKRLARYGKRLVAGEAKSATDFIGRPLELAGTTAKGQPFDWKSYRGKVVLVDFWATWCGPCRAEMPHVKELFEKHENDGLAVVGVSLDKDEEALAQYLDENSIPWSTLAGETNGELAEKYGVEGIPTMFLIDQEGKVVAVSHNVAELQPKLEELLKKATKK